MVDRRECVGRESLFVSVDEGVLTACYMQALSEFLRSITCLPSDITLLSLPPGPLLELICMASQRQLTAVWLSLANMLTIQLDPPTMFLNSTLKTPPNVEGMAVVLRALPVLLQTSLSMLGQPGAMESVRPASIRIACIGADAIQNPDIVQTFFSFLDSVSFYLIGLCRDILKPWVDRWPSISWQYSTIYHLVPLMH